MILLSKRILSAVLGIIILYLFINWGSIPFFIINVVLALIGIKEYSVLIKKKYETNLLLMLFLCLIFMSYAYLINIGMINLPFELILLLIILVMFYYFIKNGIQNIMSVIAVNFFGIIYIAGGMTYLFLLRDFLIEPFHYARALWLAFLATWAVDTGAYFAGIYLGKRKLAPILSPNKTIEGALGGIVSSCIVVTMFLLFIDKFTIQWLIYAVLLAVIAITGDLFESALKRNAKVKDSGNFIPGHGGVLDRFDSLLFTIPFTYYFLIFILK